MVKFTKNDWSLDAAAGEYVLKIEHKKTGLPNPLTHYNVVVRDSGTHPAEVDTEIRAHEVTLKVFSDPDLRFDGELVFTKKEGR